MSRHFSVPCGPVSTGEHPSKTESGGKLMNPLNAATLAAPLG